MKRVIVDFNMLDEFNHISGLTHQVLAPGETVMLYDDDENEMLATVVKTRQVKDHKNYLVTFNPMMSSWRERRAV